MVESAPAAPRDPRDLAVDVQARLADLGFDPGPIDGIVGEKTRIALRAFEKRVGQPVTGKVSEDILGQLDEAVAARRTNDPTTPPLQAEIGKTFGDWIIACAQPRQGSRGKCFARQIQVLKSQEGGGAERPRRLIDARVGYLGPNDEPAFVALLPLGVFIPAGAALRIDDGKPIPLRLEICTRAGCRAAAILDQKTLAALQASKEISVRFSPRRSGRLASIRLSPKGLSNALKALK